MLLNKILNRPFYKLWRYNFLILIIFFSCQGKDLKIIEFNTDLVKIDSIGIERETRFRILDHHSKNENLLAYDGITRSFILIDKEGKIIQEVNRRGDGPNEYNNNLITGAFNEFGKGIFLQSSNELLWYDESWNILNRWRFGSFFNIIVYGGPKFRTPYFFLEDTSKPFVFTSFFSNTYVPIVEIQSGLGSEKIIEVFDSEKDTLIWKLPVNFEMYSPYKPKDKEFDLMQVYHLDAKQNILYLSFDNSLSIGVFDLNKDFDLIHKIKINPNELFDKGKGKTVNLFPINNQDFIILRYSGISEIELENERAINENYSPLFDSRLFKFYYISNDGSVKKEMNFPENCEPNSELVLLGGERILIRDKDNEEKEMDYSSYSIFEFRK